MLAAENGPEVLTSLFSVLRRNIPEAMARRLKSKCLVRMNELVMGEANNEKVVPVVKRLPSNGLVEE